MHDTVAEQDLLQRAVVGDSSAQGELFALHRDRLRRMVNIRLDPRLTSRIDPSDVLQEAFLEFTRSLPRYVKQPSLPLFLWLRLLAQRKLQALHRHHLGVLARDAKRDQLLGQACCPPVSSVSLANKLLCRHSSPSQAVARAELRQRVTEALDQLPKLDREVLVLRHFEQLSNSETAKTLDIGEAAASNRYVRALKRIKPLLLDGGWADEGPQDNGRLAAKGDLP